MLTVVPKPLEPANKGPRQTDPCDTQTNAARRPTGTPHMFLRGNAKHPAAPRSAANIWAADVASAGETRLYVLHARLGAGVND
ncbi:hypothetical protein CesoFtcFv8_017715 [Champsocephalus esox]|uniref:Uncharacterized protein n=2 Tax=Champsocephalus TaxID=52236 RepID=A0AAN8DG36_CHAGU|nr:hypothetical protein CesoFtcFv8_017715 [Champsocephalus esox]KAK5917173.1 hypothetical protein CgunFtcFv8_012083 [Champsocephalus gunnari]